MRVVGAAERERSASFRRSVFAIYFTSLVQGSVGVLFPASSVWLRGRLAIGDTLYGALFLPGLTLALVTCVLGHVLLRRWSLKSLFVFGLISQAVTLVLMGVSGSLSRASGLPILIAAMFISGPAGGILGIALNTAAVGLFPRLHGHALSVLHGLLGSGAVLGPLLVAAATGAGCWLAAPFLVAAAVLWLAWLARSRQVEGLAETVAASAGLSDVPRRMWLRSSTVLFYGMGEATFTSWVVVFLRENRHLPLGVGAGALSLFWLAMTAGRLGSSLLLRWSNPFRISLALAAGMSVSFLLVADCRGATDSLLRFGLAGLCCSALFPLLLSQCTSEFPGRAPQVTAVFSAAVLAGLGLGSFGVGALRHLLGLRRIYAVSALWPLVLGVILVALRRGAPAAAADASAARTSFRVEEPAPDRALRPAGRVPHESPEHPALDHPVFDRER